jgi:hypothetical protein
VVASYLPYRDVAVSQQTGQPRIIFEENSGLVNVFPVECVDQAIDAWEQRQSPEDLDRQTEEVEPTPVTPESPTSIA